MFKSVFLHSSQTLFCVFSALFFRLAGTLLPMTGQVYGLRIEVSDVALVGQRKLQFTVHLAA